MKKLFIILISALTSTLYFGQDATPQQTPPPTQFTITKAEGLSPFIVVKTEGKTKEELYKKTIEWINKNLWFRLDLMSSITAYVKYRIASPNFTNYKFK